jgi:transcriptional regulator with XRE-family HTH domain
VDRKTERLARQTFGARVKQLRHAAGLSQQQLAAHAELDRSYIGGVERGERNVSLINIHKIARALKIKTEVLFQ